MGRQRETGSRPTAGPPSPVARTRLAASVQREISDLRARALEAFLRAQVLLEAGLVAEAAEVLEEQRALVARFRERVQDAVAGAVVEREAEMVLAAAPEASDLDLVDSEPDEQDEHAETSGRHGPLRWVSGAVERLPATASAALAALLALAVLVFGDTPTPQYDGVAGLYGTRTSAPAPTVEPGGEVEADLVRRPAPPRLPDPPPVAGEAFTVEQPGSGADPEAESNELSDGVRWLLDRPRSLLARLAEGSPERVADLLDGETLDDLLAGERDDRADGFDVDHPGGLDDSGLLPDDGDVVDGGLGGGLGEADDTAGTDGIDEQRLARLGGGDDTAANS